MVLQVLELKEEVTVPFCCLGGVDNSLGLSVFSSTLPREGSEGAYFLGLGL